MTRKAIPRQTRLDVLMESGYRCGNPACGTIITLDIHHIEPVEEGGDNDASNLLPLCPSCHALHTRGHIPNEAIRHWKRMLTALNRSFSREEMDLLILLADERWQNEMFTSDGVARFVGPIVAGLVEAVLHPDAPYHQVEPEVVGGQKGMDLSAWQLGSGEWKPPHYRPRLYQLRLTERGRSLVETWLAGDERAYNRALSQPPASAEDEQ